MRWATLRCVVLFGCVCAFFACDRARNEDTAQAQTPAAPAVTKAPGDGPLPTLAFPQASGQLPAIDGNRAMQYVKDIVKFGPRPLASANHKKVEDYIVAKLKGDDVVALTPWRIQVRAGLGEAVRDEFVPGHPANASGPSGHETLG